MSHRVVLSFQSVDDCPRLLAHAWGTKSLAAPAEAPARHRICCAQPAPELASNVPTQSFTFVNNCHKGQ